MQHVQSSTDRSSGTRTGSSIVAVIRSDQSIPAPGPEFGLLAGDVIVAVGTVEGLATMRDLLRR